MNSSGTVTATNTYGLAGLISRHTSSGSTFYEFDLQGTVVQRLNSAGSNTINGIADAFGNVANSGTISDPFGYEAQAGYYTDQSTGLILTTFRYYDPVNGRFLNRDPIGAAGGINVYGYCGNDAENLADPSGLTPGYVNPLNWLRIFDRWFNSLPAAEQRQLITSSLEADAAESDEENAPLAVIWVQQGQNAADEEAASDAIRLRHYTSVSASKKIESEGVIRASDQNKVFNVQAKGKVLSPSDAQDKLGIGQGKGRAIIEYDAHASEVERISNRRTGQSECNIRGNVNLSGRNPIFKRR